MHADRYKEEARHARIKLASQASSGPSTSRASHQESSSESEPEIPEGHGPSKPKVVPKGLLKKIVDDHPVMQLFFNHMTSLDGGRRKHSAAKDHMRTVGQLLQQIQRAGTQYRLLWNDACLDKLRSTVFEGNHLLDQPKQPKTLQRYTVSLNIFYKFVIARREALKEIMPISFEDMESIRSAITRVEAWSHGFAEAMAARKVTRRQIDEEELLTKEELRELVQGKASNKFEKQFLALGSAEDISHLSPKEICQYRDYLMLMVLVASAQRPGAISNLTIDEFKGGEFRKVGGEDMYITSTLLHKTGTTRGPAALFWNERRKKMGEIFLKKLRPRLTNSSNDGEIPAQPGFPEARKAFFINSNGRYMESSRVADRASHVAKKLNPDITGRLSGARLRKAFVSLHRADTDPSVSKELLALQMSHHPRTANRNYDISNEVTKKATVSEFLQKAMEKTPTKEQKGKESRK